MRFLVARGAKIAVAIWRTVPPKNFNFAAPVPSSIWSVPAMVFIDLVDGEIDWKYFLSVRMVWEVPLSIIAMFGLSSAKCSMECVTMWASGSADCVPGDPS